MKWGLLPLALVVALGSALWQLRAPQVVPEPAVLVEKVTATPIPARLDLRPQIVAKVEKDRPRLRNPRDLDGYLGGLEAEARRSHQVSALEVEPGLRAIAEQTQSPEESFERQRQFAERMAKLSAELDGRAEN